MRGSGYFFKRPFDLKCSISKVSINDARERFSASAAFSPAAFTEGRMRIRKGADLVSLGISIVYRMLDIRASIS